MNPTILEEQKKLKALGLYDGDLDGDEGPLTRRGRLAYAAQQAGLPVTKSLPASAKIYAEATKYLGIKEKPGSGTDPTIAQMFALAPDWLNQDDSQTAWCGIFRGFVGHRTGTGLPADHYRAASWLKWGSVVTPKFTIRGDTVILSRPGGNHVAIVDAYTPGADTIRLLGGNQGNSVSIAKFPVSSLRGIRRIG